jgi:hypothetical protein
MVTQIAIEKGVLILINRFKPLLNPQIDTVSSDSSPIISGSIVFFILSLQDNGEVILETSDEYRLLIFQFGTLGRVGNLMVLVLLVEAIDFLFFLG